MKPKSPAALLLSLLLFSAQSLPAAETTGGTSNSERGGVIEGRVLSLSTGEYLRNAEVAVNGMAVLGITAADGRYRITGAPAGPLTVTVTYTGYQPATATVNVAPGGTVTRDFDLQSTLTGKDSEVLRLSRFTVAAEREGTAKAIMEQRSAMNIKNVVASDTFSIMTEGNIGEVLQYMPGIHIRYSDGEPAEPMMRGMHEKYGALLIDGVRTTSGGSRAPSLGSYSAYATDTIEFNKTNSADMDADAPAGSVNMKSKSAFQRKDRYVGWQLYTIVNSVVNSLGKTPGPRDGESYKTLPSVVLDFSDVYLDGKLGVLVNLSENNSYPISSFLNPVYDTVPTAASPAPVVITQLAFGTSPKFIKRRGGGLNLEYKLSPHATLALRGQLGWEDFENVQRAFTLVSGRPNQARDANVNAMLANPTTNNATRFLISGTHLDRNRLSYTIAPQLNYERGPLSIDAAVAYTALEQHTRNGRLDGQRDPFTAASYQLFGVGFAMTRADQGDANFDFRQTAGPDLYKLSNYTATSLTNNLARVQSEPITSTLVGQLNARFSTGWRQPTFLKAGVKSSLGKFSSVNRNHSWTYVGPGGNRLTAELPVSVAFRDIAPLDGGNLFTDAAIQFPDRQVLGRLLSTNPEYFIPNPADATSAVNLFPDRSSREYIDAGYIMANSQFGRLTVQGGIRYEATKTQGRIYEFGVPKTRSGSYDDLFLSGSARYRFEKNLMMIAGFSQSIQRAPLSSMAAVATINEEAMTGTIPNLNLKPEHGDNYSLRLEKYFEPVGVISAGVFMFRMQDYHAQSSGVPAEVLGLGDEYPNFLFNTLDNVDRFTTKGFELEFSHQLSYLPGWLRGLGTFANYTQVQRSNDDLAYRAAPRFASGGISFHHGRFNVSLSGTWTSVYFQNANLYNKERILISTNCSFQLTPKLSFFLTGRNLLRDPQVGYLRQFPGVLGQLQVQGSVWSIGMKGHF